MNWKKLLIPKHELDISTVLRSGQAFRWRFINGTWSCALNNQIIILRESEQTSEVTDTQVLEYTGINPTTKPKMDTGEFLRSYFNLDIITAELYLHWSKVDVNFEGFGPKVSVAEVVTAIKEETLATPPQSERDTPDLVERSEFLGVRILSQDPWETLVSFIISSNNNIKRISQLCEVLCIQYGRHIGDYFGVPYYTFPTPQEFLGGNAESNVSEITSAVKEKLEGQLRALGFGYRAKYITKTVTKMIEDPELWKRLHQNEGVLWNDVDGDISCVEFLRQFDGVGPKVADCVALMGCRRHDLVPVDTHVWNILRSRYRNEFNKWVDNLDTRTDRLNKSALKKSLGNKGVDVKIYPFVKRFFREFWQVKAGWAQGVVFAGMVKLDNGINDQSDVQKLLDKVTDALGQRDVTAMPVTKKRKTK